MLQAFIYIDKARLTTHPASSPCTNRGIESKSRRNGEVFRTIQLARVLPKRASALDLPFRWCAAPDGRSAPFVDPDPSEGTLGLLVDNLAEAFGVTASFMSVRLAKGGFIGRRFETGGTN